VSDGAVAWFAPQRVAAFAGATDYTDAAGIAAQVDAALAALDLPDDYVRPGDRVVLKPNWVKEHDERHPRPGHWEHVVTHPAVVEAVVRWVAPRLRGSGSITLCDAPQTDSSFRTLRAYCGLDALLARCRAAFPGIAIDVLDLRPEEWRAVDGVVVEKTQLSGDPLGHTHVRLDARSEFVGFAGEGRLYGASYDMAETNARHRGSEHHYLLCRTPMDADVLVNLPKLKTHKKVGLTCALKNLVGINANKNWLPHHTEGTPEQGGDQFPVSSVKTRLEHTWMGRAKRLLKDSPALSRVFIPVKSLARVFFGDTRRVVRSGNWHGNDTCWRMVLDLNKCLFQFDGAGAPRAKPLRYLAVVDGIVGGEGNGPMAPDPVACGVILAGTHPLAVDCVAATLMGFDWRRIRLLANAFAMRAGSFVPFAAGDIDVRANRDAWQGPLDALRDTFAFRPHFGWTGAIERAPAADAA
jgi:uncharacterized protein (DUF362 family)